MSAQAYPFKHVRSGEPGGEGQLLYPAVRMDFWQAEKSCHFEVV
jgi:hypothetical protein